MYDDNVDVNNRLQSCMVGLEISGTVVGGDSVWIGREVLFCAGMDCRDVDDRTVLRSGYSNYFPVQIDSLCEIRNRTTIPLEQMAAVADTVATAYHAVRQGAVGKGDRVVVIGSGGSGPFAMQIAKALGAESVVVVDLQQINSKELLRCGADIVVNGAGKTVTQIAGEVRSCVDAKGCPETGWKIFETTGHCSGLEIATHLVGRAGKLIRIVSRDAVCDSLPLDSKIIIVSGCPREDYPQVVALVASGKITLSPFVQTRPMSWIREVFAEARASLPGRHIVLTADDIGNDDILELKSCR